MSAKMDRARHALEEAAVRFAMGTASGKADLERAARAFFSVVSEDDTGDLPTVADLKARDPLAVMDEVA